MATAETPRKEQTTELDAAQRRRMMRRAVISSAAGTTIEWYDFFLYGVAAALVFPQKFFPGSDPYVATLLAFSTYFVGFVARPFGAAIFGHYGDRMGRKAALIATLVLMAQPRSASAWYPTTTRSASGELCSSRSSASCKASASAASGAARC